MNLWWSDLFLAIRLLHRRPVFALATMTVLAVAIGTSTTAFSLTSIVLFRSLPVEFASRLIFVTAREEGQSACRLDQCRLFAENENPFESVSFAASQDWALQTLGGARELRIEMVSGKYFETLGVGSYAGRLLTTDDDRIGSPAAAVITNALAINLFGSAAEALGQSVNVVKGQTAFTIVGVVWPTFRGLGGPLKPTDLWMTFGARLDALRTAARAEIDEHALGAEVVIGRVKDGTGVAQVAALLPRWEQIRLNTSGVGSPSPAHVKLQASDSLRTRLPFTSLSPETLGTMLAGLACAVLIVSLVNLSGLFLTRMIVQAPELATRISLGARRADLVRRPALEALLLSGTAGLLGFAGFRWLAIHLLSRAPNVAIASATDFSPRLGDLWVLAGLCLASAAILIIPALRISGSRHLRRALNDSSIASRAGRARLLDWFVITQVALSTAILIPGWLTVREFVTTLSVERGYDVHDIAFVRVMSPNARPSDEARSQRTDWSFYRRWLAAVEGSRGVTRAALTSGTPVSAAMALIGAPRGPRLQLATAYVSSGYLDVLGLGLIAGRWFNDSDGGDNDPVVILDKTAASLLSPNQNLLGRPLITPNGRNTSDGKVATVVGIVSSVRPASGGDFVPFVYMPVEQSGTRPLVHTLIARGKTSMSQLVNRITDAAKATDTTYSILRGGPLSAEVSRQNDTRRLAAEIMSACAAIALLLGCLGCYSTMKYAVAQRTPELAIRMALGADKDAAVRLILRTAIRVSILGALLGISLAFFVNGWISHTFHQLSPIGGLGAVVIVVIVIGTVSGAGYLAARHAKAVVPAALMRRT